jgi:hypothetical protein
MKRLLIITSLIVAGFFNLSAQETQIDLSKYKLPDMKRQTLEFEFDLNNSFNKNYYSTSEGDLSRNNYLSSALDVYYSFFKNSVKWQQELYASFSIGGSNNEYREFGQIDYAYRSLSSSIALSSINRYYFNELFVGFNPSLNTSYWRRNDESFGTHYKDYTSRFNTYVPIHVGYGRIERVEDARQAAYIYNALVKKAKAKGGKSQEDLLMLAEKISQLKNERFFDSRNKKIYELEELDKYLKENGFIDEDDITYFATLEDMWEYGNSPSRWSGFRASAFVNPGYYIYENVDRAGYDSYYNYKYYLLKTGVKLDYAKPINMYWQNTLSFTSYYGISRNRTNGRYQLRNDWRTPGIHIGISDQIGFYPNTRTYLSAYSYVYLAKQMDKPKNEESIDDYVGSFKGKSLRTGAGFSGYYYFSPQLRLNGSLGVFYSADIVDPDYENVDYYSPDNDGWNYDGGFTNSKNLFDYQFSLSIEYFLF